MDPRTPLLLAAAITAGCGARAAQSPSPQLRGAAATTGGAPRSPWHAIVGRSALGRPIRAAVLGAPGSRRTMLVVGCVHGDERAGLAITRALRRVSPVPGVALWVVDAANPDGCRAHTRQNARGVDLNRNAPWRWRRAGQRGSTFYSGPRVASEPETRAIIRLVRRLRPGVSVWYHQHAALVDDSGGDRRIERRYGRLVGLPFRHFGTFHGSITSWQDATFRKDTAFVVELPAGRLGRAATTRHVRALLALARALP